MSGKIKQMPCLNLLKSFQKITQWFLPNSRNKDPTPLRSMSFEI